MPRPGIRGPGLTAIAAAVVLAAAHPASAALRSDEFDTPTLDPAVWAFFDPLSDSALQATGSHAVISVPAGQAHDMWANLNSAPRLLQAASNEDFELEVKFDSTVSAAYQQQGIVVQGGGNDLLRLELHSDGGGTKLFAAAIDGGSASVKHYAAVVGGAPAYLRLVRAGDSWTLRYSRDGATWIETATFTQPMNVTAVGPFAGNGGDPPPAFASSIDYFRVIGTDTTAPAIADVGVSPGPIAATVSWTTDEPATSSVAYGAGTNYSGTAGRESPLAIVHSVVVPGLACETTYHFQIRSADAAGNEAQSNDATFTTGACPTTMVSDEFNSQPLDTGVWTFVDPLGDSQLMTTGSHAVISVPAGVVHDIWTNANFAPRLVQAAPDDDFQVEVKFSSAVGQGYQQQGVVVEQDGDSLIRLEAHHDGSGTRLFVASFDNGNPTVHAYTTIADAPNLYLRLERSGDTWRLSHSSDGSTWALKTTFVHDMTVAAVGPFAGNGGGAPPAFAGSIDYFRYTGPDRTSPQLADVTVAPSAMAATVSWTTNEPASSKVAYGADATYGSMAGWDAFATVHSVVLHGLACGTPYHFEIRSADSAGNETRSGDVSFSTSPCPAAMVSDEFNSQPLDTSVWTFVDPLGDSQLMTTGSHAVISVPAGTVHDIWTNANFAPRLLQAAPDDDFDVEVKFDSSVGQRYQQQGLVVEQDTQNLIRLEAHHDGSATRVFVATFENGAPTIVEHSTLPTAQHLYLRLKRSGDIWKLWHSSDGAVWTLKAAFSHALTVAAVGPFAGNGGGTPPAFAGSIDYFRYTPPDRTPPVITNIAATPGAGSTVRVTWTTDEPSSSAVAFGSDSGYSDGVLTAPGDSGAHAVVLHGVPCAATIHYQARSTDSSGNASASGDRTVTTLPCPDLLTTDEFDGSTLDASRWAFVDPLGDSSAAVGGGHATIAVPAGSAHDLWPGVRDAPRLLQALADRSFEVVVKFDSAVSARYQLQGLVVEASHDHLLRFETHSEWGTAFVFVAALEGASAQVLHYASMPTGAPVYLRLRRAGDFWTFSYSQDGEAWAVATSFTYALPVTAVGPYAGNSGGTPPAFDGMIDHFREITDRTPPVLADIEGKPRSRSAVVRFTTDELADSTVEYRQGTGAWQQVHSSKLETLHSVTLPSLACATTYAYRIRSADGLGNAAASAEKSVTTGACTPSGGPDIDVWYGDSQTFGTVGIPQRWVNVVGNVYDPDGVESLTGSLNGRMPEPLNFAPDGWRLERPGDFNYEVNHADLVPGTNTVELRAVDGLGNATVRQVAVTWRGVSAGPAPAANGPVLVVAAHPDDESLGMAGIVKRARADGRRVLVAIATNGDSGSQEPAGGECGIVDPDRQRHAAYGLMRNGEAERALGVLGLARTANPATTELVFLGYPDGRIVDVAQSGSPIWAPTTGLQRTYAGDFDGDVATCNGDFRYLLSGQHSELSAPALASDFDALLALVSPSDVYTHAPFDGHPDHAEVARQVVSAVRRRDTGIRLHTTLVHPEGATFCMQVSTARWPNPALVGNDPFARFTPWLDVTAPPKYPCDTSAHETHWGPFGPPNELVEVPAAMQDTTEATNLKWQAISKHESQTDCSNPADYHVTCGFMRAFVKRSEFFWRYDYGQARHWPKPYTTQWTSDASIAEQAQILEGEWRFTGDGVRPLTTGFDRALILGDMGWKDYEITVPITINSLAPSEPDIAAGVALGWQGHSDWGQPRLGHPGGGLCLYARGHAEPAPFALQVGYSPGPVHDTTVAVKDMALAIGETYMFRFRQKEAAAGYTRYSCKVWRADQPEPAAWTLEADIPDWPGETDQHPGSAVLLAHRSDATFGNATIAPVGD